MVSVVPAAFRSKLCAGASHQNKQNGEVNRKKYDVRFAVSWPKQGIEFRNKMLDLEVVPERSLGNEEWEFVLGKWILN